MEKIILLTLTYLVGVGELILAIFFWKTHSNNEIRKVMALLAFSTGMWVILSAAIAYQGQTELTLFLSDIIFVFGAFLLTSLFYFSIIFPYPILALDRFHVFLLYLPALLFSIISVSTNGISVGITGSSDFAGEVIPGPIYNIYNLFLFSLYVASIFTIQRRLHRVDGLMRKNLRAILFAILFGGMPAVYVDLLLPVLNLPSFNYLIGNLFTGVWLSVVTYIVVKK